MATETLRPTGEGSNTNLSEVGGLTNWQCVADDSDASYVRGASSSYLLDTYATADTSIPAGSTINSVTIRIRTKTTVNTKASYCKQALKSGETVYYGDEIEVTSSTLANMDFIWTTNPADSGAWEVSDLDALEAGVALKDGTSSSYYCRCAAVYMIIDYTAPVGGRMCQVIII